MDSWTSDKFDVWNNLHSEYLIDEFEPPPQSSEKASKAPSPNATDASENCMAKRPGHRRRTQGVYDELSYDSTARENYYAGLDSIQSDQGMEKDVANKSWNLSRKRQMALFIFGFCAVGAIVAGVDVVRIHGNIFIK